MKFFSMILCFYLLIALPAAALAQDREMRDCRRELAQETEPYWTLLRWMADYRAAIDAGYEGCSEVYPDRFQGAEAYFTYWQENTKIEYEQGFEVANKLVREIFSDLDHKCLPDKHEKLVDDLQKNARSATDSQYEKAHQRRLKALTHDGLSGSGEDALLEFDENDSCKHVLTTLENYRRYHTSREDARFVLYTFATEHSAMTKQLNRDTRHALRDFERERKKITPSVFGN